MDHDGVGDGGEVVIEREDVPHRRPGALERLAQAAAQLTRLVESGELESELQRVMMVNPVTHGGRVVSYAAADVVHAVARSTRPVPLSRLLPRQVAWLPGLARAGFVIVEHGAARVTPRGRALGAFRQREQVASKLELGRLAATLGRV